MNSPTACAYPELERAYRHFNRDLFDGELPPLLITLQRKTAKTYGYYSPGRFIDQRGERTDELAMNPSHFQSRELLDTLSTLAHEMVHVWESHFGNPGRRGYHNKAWGTRMKALGLQPSDTGEPGGKETGEQMTHYIIEGGPFERSARALMASGFTLSWAEYIGSQEVRPAGEPEPPGAKVDAKPKSKGRIKFVCPSCRNNAWGRPTLRLMCADCMKVYVPIG